VCGSGDVMFWQKDIGIKRKRSMSNFFINYSKYQFLNFNNQACCEQHTFTFNSNSNFTITIGMKVKSKSKIKTNKIKKF
jgi:hypothetical protein